MIEEQIDKVFLRAQHQPVLPAHETKAVAQLQDEVLQSFHEPVLQFALLHGAPESEEFQVVAALHRLLGLLGKMLRQRELEIVRLLLRPRPLICAGLDLV